MAGRIIPISRRRFCADACCAALATAVAACGGSPTSPDAPATMLATVTGQLTGGGVRVVATGSALDNEGGAVLVDSVAGLFLVARTSADAVTAIDAVCTHEGCTVNGAAGATYVCPCHGSRYSRTGQVLEGPATASLRQYPATLANGVVTISL